MKYVEYIERSDWDKLDAESLEIYVQELLDQGYPDNSLIEELFQYIDNLKEVGNVHVFDLQDADD
jgi:hypothetical protein